LIDALDAAGIEMIDEGAISHSQGRGVRLKMNPAAPKARSDHQAPPKAPGATRGRR
jgi:hypothetical protein